MNLTYFQILLTFGHWNNKKQQPETIAYKLVKTLSTSTCFCIRFIINKILHSSVVLCFIRPVKGQCDILKRQPETIELRPDN